MRDIELLAPAKDYELGCAAIDCGADAIYVGAPRFGARAAAGVSVQDIERLCSYAHRFGVRVYVALNTLIYDGELAEAEEIAHNIYDAGADALIIQDMSLLRMNIPPIELHSSTQMFNVDPVRAKFLAEVGFSRLILERALDLDQIEAIAQAVPDTEIEAFIHGAICVSYSGRCFMSRTLGSRSGNRGVCSQSCRLPYNLLDASQRPLQKDLHILSLYDMNLTEHLEPMIDRGVTSFKIEGRLKDITYVKNIVGWYRSALDEIIDRRSDLARLSRGVSKLEFRPDPVKSFSRGATSYFIDGVTDNVASFDTPKSLGEYLGTVIELNRDRFSINLSETTKLANGDGICFMAADGKLVGTNINKVEGRYITPNRIDGLTQGAEVFRNYDHLFVAAVNRSRVRRAIPISATVVVEPTVIKLELCLDDLKVGSSKNGTFDVAQNAEKADATLRTQISKMGDTIYVVDSLEVLSDEVRFVPISLLNELRREAVESIDKAVIEKYIRRTRKPENAGIEFPLTKLTGDENVTNSLSEKFYKDHGVTEIETAYDLRDDLKDCAVMRMKYCIRREMGECLKENSSYTDTLYIENGLHIYELKFDCARCEMSLIYKGEREKIIRKTAEF